jgi:cytochrome c oxidase accessory protein FixG
MVRDAADTTKKPMDEQTSLYQSAPKIYAREVEGTFDRLRDLATIALLGVYYCLPWLSWDDRQAILWDLPARKFYIFGLTFFPQDFIYLAWLLIIAAIALFFFTALAGRIWCGYACPQTVWTQAFVWMERLTEGNRSKRMKLDKSPWNANKILRKGGKQVLWVLFSLWTGFVFVGYFTPVRELDNKIIELATGPWETFWILFYAFATYGNAGFMREQVCKYMCPYARFQSAMFDSDSLIVAYDEKRGEPRGSRSRKSPEQDKQLGDCINCTLCVQVCPTGIDIRKGLQYECIACAACVDACDGVMDQMGYARGLIKYTTENAREGKKTRVVRARTIIYGSLLLILLIGLTGALSSRHVMRMDVLRDRNALYRELNDGRIENVYTLKLLNKSEQELPISVSVSGLPDISIDTDPSIIILQPGEVTVVPARVQADPQTTSGGGHEVTFTATAEDGEEFDAQARFILPTGKL